MIDPFKKKSNRNTVNTKAIADVPRANTRNASSPSLSKDIIPEFIMESGAWDSFFYELPESDKPPEKEPSGKILKSITSAENILKDSDIVQQWSKSKLLYDVENGKKVIIACTLDDLLSYLIEGPDDFECLEQFLYPHSYYINSVELFKKLDTRYKHPLGTDLPLGSNKQKEIVIQNRVAKIFLRWYENHYYEFLADNELKKLMLEFINHTLYPCSLEEDNQKKEKLKQFKELIFETEVFVKITNSHKARDTHHLVELISFMITTNNFVREHKKNFRTVLCFIASEVIDWMSERYALDKSDCCKVMDRLVQEKEIKPIARLDKQKHFSYGDMRYKFIKKKDQKDQRKQLLQLLLETQQL